MHAGPTPRDGLAFGRAWACVATVLVAAVLPAPRSANAAGSVTALVAASTADAVAEIAEAFTAQTRTSVVVTPGSSSRLAKQIAEGADADVFLSADQANADWLATRGLVREQRPLLSNRLVVVVPAGGSTRIDDLDDLAGPAIGEVALAIPGVPAGEYARQALRTAGLWKAIEPKSIGGDDVRAALAFVERGADAGVVYRTDCDGNANIGVAFEVDPSLHDPILYPLVLVAREGAAGQGKAFFEHLRGEAAARVFAARGFSVVGEDGQ